MADVKSLEQDVARLKRECSELSGMSLATGIILTQLLQTMCKREMNPQGVAGRVMAAAREGIQGFASATNADPVMTKRALEAVDQYEEQIRSVLAV